jgi:putative tryptophan/tyrosine transport system substrate-binding protein
MRRRDLLAFLAASTVAQPLLAQQPSLPVIGVIGGVSPDAYIVYTSAFLQGLKDSGFVEGQNVRIEQRWAHGQLDRLPSLIAELVGLQVSTIVALGGTSVAIAAKNSATTIPIVFSLGSDPVEDGLVASLNSPGGNITGVTFFTNALVSKRLELLRELMPQATLIAVLINPKNARAGRDTSDTQAAADSIGQRVHFVQAGNPDEIDACFSEVARVGASALLVTSDAFFASRREQMVVLAARHRIPAIYGQREVVAAGGLVSYGSNIANSHRQAGIYAAKILAGIKPADLPVMQPTRFDLVINLRAAKALGLSVPPILLARADEVIE